ncbi:hypothetical protein LCM10_15065 [Rossellomorea aquimaris]|uniref:hypothetical protein n=1 Tax=Rossellomorea aquimaris TaxID=189382 RepID=UPI001CD2F578|nr:hypothetical protein [Rossellomorea aquimaris]MCA1056319.1 hypothetical protein [Rossellomorea aquimaris]
MKIDFSKKQWTILISSTLCALFILVGVNVFYLQPAEKRLEYKQDELGIQVKLQEAVEEKVNSLGADEPVDSTSLQKKIPVEPMTESLILDLEQAELVSGSSIQSIVFEQSEEAPEAEGNPETDGNATDDVIPPQLKRIGMTIVVESPSYFEMEAFLEQIEGLQRIVEVDGLYFEGEEELKESMEGYSEDVITFEVVASAFYLPDLQDLVDAVPRIQSPMPSLKKDPFPQFSDESE